MSRIGTSHSFLGFLLRVVLSLPLWFLMTALMTYVFFKLLDMEPPLTDVLMSLNLNKFLDYDITFGLPLLILSGFLSLVIIWAVMWRR